MPRQTGITIRSETLLVKLKRRCYDCLVMDITYLGHSSFHIKGKTASVVTDPFDPGKVGIRYPKVEATVVTVSHDHDDHNKVELVENVKKVISGPGEYEIEGISIVGLPTFHDDKKGEERGRNTIYVYELEGLTLLHLGDLGHKLSEDTLNLLGEIDVLMIPVGGYYTIDAKLASEIVHSIEPRITIPMHYNVPGRPENPLTDEKLFINEMGLTVRQEKRLSLKAGAFPEDTQEIVVLEIV